MNWKYKALLMHVFSTAPFGRSLYYWSQRKVSKSLPSSDEKFLEIFGHAARHVSSFKQVQGKGISEAYFYEFGAGRDLAIPMSFYALGVQRQMLVDIRPLLRAELVNDTIAKLQRFKDKLGLCRTPQKFLPLTSKSMWLDTLEESYGITYKAPCDARDTGLEGGAIDCITSTNTFEHIPTSNIASILKECKRLLNEKGLLSFIIDYKDHYSYVDKRISPYNFLRYSGFWWSLCNPALHFQNRMRHKDYLELFAQQNLEVHAEDLLASSDSGLQSLRELPLESAFAAHYAFDELSVCGSHIILGKRNLENWNEIKKEGLTDSVDTHLSAR
jgi:SAM-dependent methyltransferase